MNNKKSRGPLSSYYTDNGSIHETLNALAEFRENQPKHDTSILVQKVIPKKKRGEKKVKADE